MLPPLEGAARRFRRLLISRCLIRFLLGCLAAERWASGAAGSRSDAGAEAGSGRLHALVRCGTGTTLCLWTSPPSDTLSPGTSTPASPGTSSAPRSGHGSARRMGGRGVLACQVRPRDTGGMTPHARHAGPWGALGVPHLGRRWQGKGPWPRLGYTRREAGPGQRAAMVGQQGPTRHARRHGAWLGRRRHAGWPRRYGDRCPRSAGEPSGLPHRPAGMPFLG